MTPEFRAIEASGCIDVPAPCFLCGCESHCFAEDSETGKDVCEKCCVSGGDDYPELDPGEYEPSEERDPYYPCFYENDNHDDFWE
jgi:hypothetical protein